MDGAAAALSRVAHKGNADSMLISRRDAKAAAADMRATAVEEANRASLTVARTWWLPRSVVVSPLLAGTASLLLRCNRYN